MIANAMKAFIRERRSSSVEEISKMAIVGDVDADLRAPMLLGVTSDLKLVASVFARF